MNKNNSLKSNHLNFLKKQFRSQNDKTEVGLEPTTYGVARSAYQQLHILNDAPTN